jgi:RimJ/RimL family protein N-acetyltransferase
MLGRKSSISELRICTDTSASKEMLRQKLFQNPLPVLTTNRLTLLPFTEDDVEHVQAIFNHKDVAAMTILTGYPFESSAALTFIQDYQKSWTAGENAMFAIVPRDTGYPVGEVSLDLRLEHDTGELGLGYTLNPEFWGRGIAARRVLEFGFYDLDLQCVNGVHWPCNAASGNVMKKLGMKHEGRLRRREKKWGKYLDLESYSILVEEFNSTGLLTNGCDSSC